MIRTVGSGLLLAAIAALIGCQHPEDYRWSGRAEYVVGSEVREELARALQDTHTDYREPQVAVYSIAAPPKDPAPPSIKDLSGHGQAALIQAMTRPGIGDKIVQKVFSAPNSVGVTSSLTPKSEPNRFERILVATVTKGLDNRPGDRLMWTWTLIKPVNFSFAGYTILATDTGTLDIEHIEHVTSTSLQGTVSGTIPAGGATVNPSVTGSVSNQATSSAEINQQFVKASVDIEPSFLRIYRESERNLDVAGNTLMSLAVVTDPDKYRDPSVETLVLRASNPVLSKNGRPLAPAAASLDVVLLKSPPHCPLRAKVRLVYQLRRITANERSYIEGKQRVSIEQHATPWNDAEIVSADEVQPPLWEIRGGRIPVEGTTPNREILPLAFPDYEAARDMAMWMMATRAGRIGKSGLILTLGGEPMPSPYPRLIASRLGDETNCSGTAYRRAPPS